MALNEYYLRIDRFTQNRYSGDPEVDVQPDRIDHEKNRHVYLTGVIPLNRSVQLQARRLTFSPTDEIRRPSPGVGQAYKASLPHYTLTANATYLLKAVDDVQDPWAITSHEVTTT